MTKLAFVGAGSVVFTKNLLGDILEFPELHGVEIALHDIDADRLATAEAMARYVARERGASRAVLFTGNPSAVRTYEALGFRRVGDYSLVLLR